MAPDRCCPSRRHANLSHTRAVLGTGWWRRSDRMHAQ